MDLDEVGPKLPREKLIKGGSNLRIHMWVLLLQEDTNEAPYPR